MNPYIEQEDVWHDFHERAMPAIAEILLPQLRPNYIVKLDQHAYVHELPAEERRLIGRPDISVAAQRHNPEMHAQPGAMAAPIYGMLPAAVDIERQSYIEIRDRIGRQIVTVIELLSPANKRPGGDRDLYLAKRDEFLRSPAHLVEIDLLRGGPRLPVEGLPECDYCALVSRADDRPRVGIWPFRLQDPLTSIPIPLRADDAEAKLDLQKLVNRVYDSAGYVDYIYDGNPQPPLNAETAGWATEVVQRS